MVAARALPCLLRRNGRLPSRYGLTGPPFCRITRVCARRLSFFALAAIPPTQSSATPMGQMVAMARAMR